MIPKSGYRFSEKIMSKVESMIPKSGYRFSEEIMLKVESQSQPAQRIA
jgi:DNA-binding winged helix-turn-helix (wHTH) protein